MKAGPLRWRAAGWLGAHLPDVRGRDRVTRTVRGSSRSCNPTRGRLVNGLVFDIDRATDGSVHSLIFLQYTKPALAAVVECFARPGAVIYDVGANIGIYALWAATGVGPGGQVHAFEPVPATAALLSRFVEANRASQVSISEIAVGARPGLTALFCVPDASGLASMTSQPGTIAIDVATTTLDAYALEHDPPSLVKVDVEGHEPEVVAGAASILRNQRPALLLEVATTPTSAGAAQLMIAAIREIGYEVFDLTRHGLQVSRWPTSQNVLALDLAKGAHRCAFDELRTVSFPRNQTT